MIKQIYKGLGVVILNVGFIMTQDGPRFSPSDPRWICRATRSFSISRLSFSVSGWTPGQPMLTTSSDVEISIGCPGAPIAGWGPWNLWWKMEKSMVNLWLMVKTWQLMVMKSMVTIWLIYGYSMVNGHGKFQNLKWMFLSGYLCFRPPPSIKILYLMSFTHQLITS